MKFSENRVMAIVTPGIFVSKIVKIERVATQAGGFKAA